MHSTIRRLPRFCPGCSGQLVSNWCPGKLDDSTIWTWQVEVRSSHTLPTPTSCASWTWGSSPSFATWGLQTLQSCSVVLLETGDTYKNVDVRLGNRHRWMCLVHVSYENSCSAFHVALKAQSAIWFLRLQKQAIAELPDVSPHHLFQSHVYLSARCQISDPHPTDLSGHNRWAARFSPSAPFVNEVDVLLRASKATRHVKFSDPFSWAQDSIHFACTWTEDIFGMGSPILFHQTWAVWQSVQWKQFKSLAVGSIIQSLL